MAHHGKHKVQSTRGIVAAGQDRNPILRGIANGAIWTPTDAYKVRLPLPEETTTLLLGQVVEGMKESDPAAEGAVNDPMMPVAWTRMYHEARVFTTTMGSAQDLLNEAFRRLLVNACYWAVGLEGRIDARSNVALVGEYVPLAFGFGGAAKGLRPGDR